MVNDLNQKRAMLIKTKGLMEGAGLSNQIFIGCLADFKNQKQTFPQILQADRKYGLIIIRLIMILRIINIIIILPDLIFIKPCLLLGYRSRPQRTGCR